MSYFRTLVPQQETLTCCDELWAWPELQEREEAGYHALTPIKYKVKDFSNGILQFEAVVTQKDEDAWPHQPFSTATVMLEYLDYAAIEKLLSLPDLRRILFLAPTDVTHFLNEKDFVIGCVVDLFKSLHSLHSVVLPIDVKAGVAPILAALRHHIHLIQLELSLPSTFTFPNGQPEVEMALCHGFHEFQQLQKVILPSEILTHDLLFYLGKLENLKYLKIKPAVGATGGDHFIDLVRQDNISSANAFHALRQLDLDVAHTRSSKFSSLIKRFPDIEYL